MALVSSARSTIPTFGDGLELAADLLELVSFVELFLTNFSNRCQQKIPVYTKFLFCRLGWNLPHNHVTLTNLFISS